MSEPAVHTCEHILNRTMVDMFGCPRSRNAHIERKKSKCDYLLSACPTDEQVAAIEAKVNEIIASGLDVTIEFMDRGHAAAIVDLSKLSEDVSEGRGPCATSGCTDNLAGVIVEACLSSYCVIKSHHSYRLVATYFKTGAEDVPSGINKSAFLHHTA